MPCNACISCFTFPTLPHPAQRSVSLHTVVSCYFCINFTLFSAGNTTLSERLYSHSIRIAYSKRCGQKHRSCEQAVFPTIWSIKTKKYCKRIQQSYHQVQDIFAYIKNFNEPNHLALLFDVNALLTAGFSSQSHFITKHFIKILKLWSFLMVYLPD